MQCQLARGIVLAFAVVCQALAWAGAEPPNVLLILTDDQGYGDVGAFGATDIATPNLDALARDGVRLTRFYAQPTCGPSRAALMTGNFPVRIGMNFDPLPNSERGIVAETRSLAGVLSDQGYRSMYIGKWHLGDQPGHLPTEHGFDDFFGIPYSNDMWPFHHRLPIAEGETGDPRLMAAKERVALTGGAHADQPFPRADLFPDLPLIDGQEVLELNPDQNLLSERFTERGVAFIEEADNRPFFLMVGFTSPHVPLGVHPDFRGNSARDLYGDVIQEIDTRIGELLAAVEQAGALQSTLVIFLSDNGPWKEYGIDGGDSGPFRGGKTTRWEGGWRVPAIVRWSDRLPRGSVVDEITSMVDILPTVAAASGATPGDMALDGTNLLPMLSGEMLEEDRAFLYFADFRGTGATSPITEQLLAVTSGRWKLHVRVHRSDWLGWLFGPEVRPVALYDLETDPGEKNDLLSEQADIADELASLAEDQLEDLCDGVRPWVTNGCG